MMDERPVCLSGGVAGNGASYGVDFANNLRFADEPLILSDRSPDIDHCWLFTIRTICSRYVPSCPLDLSPVVRHACYEGS
jgi:hypothetical protein